MRKMVGTRWLRVVIVLKIALFQGFAFGQGLSLLRGSFGELDCPNIAPIQREFLSFHINYSLPTRELKRRTEDQFVKKLDGAKIYLFQKDVKQIKSDVGSMFDKLAKNDCGAVIKAQELLIKRIKERLAFVRSHLGDKKFKFQPKTVVDLDPDKRNYPKDVDEANAFHKKYLQFQIASYLVMGETQAEAQQQVIRNYERVLRGAEEYRVKDLWTNYLDSFARSLDPHSSYMSREELEDFNISMNLKLDGIGATLSSQDGFTVIEYLVPGGAAARSNQLRAKDRIIAVGQGDAGEFENIVEMSLRDVVRKIRGQKGTKVRLRVLRKKGKDSGTFTVTLVRDQVRLDEEAASVSYIEREVGGAKKKVALLSLPSFYSDNRENGRSAGRDLKKLLAEVRAAKADAVVLDLSTNGGGVLEEAVRVTGLFIARGNVVKQSHRDAEQAPLVLADTDDSVDWAGPLVVLTSRLSASASEIVAGALKDYRRAVVVGGDHTFGKGTVQSVQYLARGAFGAARTTIGMFYTPNGQSTQHVGVDGDIIFPSIYATDEVGEKTLDYSLPEDKTVPFLSAEAFLPTGPSAWQPLTKPIVERLRKQSEARVKGDKEFLEIQEELKKTLKRGRTVTVGEIIENKEKAKKKNGKKGPNPDADSDDGDVYLSKEERQKKYLQRPDVREAVAIAGDLMAELSRQNLVAAETKDAPKN